MSDIQEALKEGAVIVLSDGETFERIAENGSSVLFPNGEEVSLMYLVEFYKSRSITQQEKQSTFAFRSY